MATGSGRRRKDIARQRETSTDDRSVGRFQSGSCNTTGCQKVHVAAACGGNRSFVKCRCISNCCQVPRQITFSITYKPRSCDDATGCSENDRRKGRCPPTTASSAIGFARRHHGARQVCQSFAVLQLGEASGIDQLAMCLRSIHKAASVNIEQGSSFRRSFSTTAERE